MAYNSDVLSINKEVYLSCKSFCSYIWLYWGSMASCFEYHGSEISLSFSWKSVNIYEYIALKLTEYKRLVEFWAG